MTDEEDRKRAEGQVKRERVSKEITGYLRRYDCKNIDPTVNPIDLLREVHFMMVAYDEEIEELWRTIEKLRVGETDRFNQAKADLHEAQQMKAALEHIPWLKDLVKHLPKPA